MRLVKLILVLTAYSAIGIAAETTEQRYRGDYTFGHEVNSFCPEINSQCYWVAGRTSDDLQRSLRHVYENRTSQPYQSVCLVIAGSIDRDSPRDGFAQDFDGVLSISNLFGTCTETKIVTQTDLQHHRWVLTSIDGRLLDSSKQDHVIPELDFGEQMHIAGNTGCNYFAGTARLEGDSMSVSRMVTTTKHCTPAQGELELVVSSVIRGKPRIELENDSELHLDSGSTVLSFTLKDWVH
jgi:heat shock protein HslJ